MVEKIVGKKYELDLASSQNFEEYLVALGLAPGQVAAAKNAIATYMLTLDGDNYTLHVFSDVKNTTTTFQLGKEFDHTTADGRKVKVTYTRDGNKLVEVQAGEKVSTVTREFSVTEMKTTLTVDGVTATRTFKAL